MATTFSGPALRAARRRAHIRAAALAHAAGRSRRTVHAYETGAAQPPLAVAAQLAEELGIALADLLTPAPEREREAA